jgi:hypothetical protein
MRPPAWAEVSGERALPPFSDRSRLKRSAMAHGRRRRRTGPPDTRSLPLLTAYQRLLTVVHGRSRSFTGQHSPALRRTQTTTEGAGNTFCEQPHVQNQLVQYAKVGESTEKSHVHKTVCSREARLQSKLIFLGPQTCVRLQNPFPFHVQVAHKNISRLQIRLYSKTDFVESVIFRSP